MKIERLFILAVSTFIAISCTESSPKKAEKIEWNYQGKKELIYDYVQKSSSTQSTNGEELSTDFFLEGDLAMMIREGLQADLELRGVTTAMIQPNTGDTTKREVQNRFLAKGMKTNGQPENPSDRGVEIFQFIFPVPDTLMSEGQSITSPMKFPFNTPTGIYFAVGEQTITLKKIIETEKERRAIIETNVSVSELDLPPSLLGNYYCKITGGSTFSFDLTNQHFTTGNIDLNVHVTTEDGSTKVVSDSKTHYDLTLKDIVSVD